MQTIPLDQVVVGDRARNIDISHAEELAESIRKEGLLQSIVLRRSDNRIIAGGHRFHAFTILATNTDIPEEERAEYKAIPFQYFDEYLVATGRLAEDAHISDGQLMVLEMEENLKRLDMSWQDKCKGIYNYHRQQIREGRKQDVKWMQETTGKMLGLSQASVSQNLKIGEELVTNPNSPLAKCESLADALRFKVAQKLDEACRLRAARIRERTKEAQTSAKDLQDHQRAEGPPPGGHEPGSEPGPQSQEAQPGNESRAYPLDLISGLFYHGDFRETLPRIAAENKIDHIICDPPYGIDMKNLDKFDSIDRIEDTHQVEDNKLMLVDFLEMAYSVISENGFLCMWYDLDLHELLHVAAKKIGWRVCRWPLVWCKSTPCRNSAAQYNFTKSTEVCMILRRSEKSVLVTKQPNNFIVAPAVSSSTHPFVKPFSVWERLINAVSMKNQTIVDPFAGEGSCIAAALQLERYALGCEIDQNHIDQGIGYLDRELNKTAKVAGLFEDDTPF